MSACEQIAPDARFIPLPEAETSVRTVLLEEFTGQKCLNCPVAAEEIDSLHKRFGAARFISVAIHAGAQALASTPTVKGLATADGAAYAAHFQVDEQPVALINRQGGLHGKELWAAKVYQALNEPPQVTMQLHASYTPTERTMQLALQAQSLQARTDAKLQLWLVEDSIQAVQRLPSGKYQNDYCHRHVFRHALNGTWGEACTLTAEPQQYRYNFSLPEDVQAHRASIVAFFYNESEVLQAIQVPLVATDAKSKAHKQ